MNIINNDFYLNLPAIQHIIKSHLVQYFHDNFQNRLRPDGIDIEKVSCEILESIEYFIKKDVKKYMKNM